jgi:hypothetical protein
MTVVIELTNSSGCVTARVSKLMPASVTIMPAITKNTPREQRLTTAGKNHMNAAALVRIAVVSFRTHLAGSIA